MQPTAPAVVRGAVLLALAAYGCGTDGRSASSVQGSVKDTSERVFAEAPPVWYEEYYTAAYVSADARRAIYAGPGRFRLLDLERASEATDELWPGVTGLAGAAFGPYGDLALLGSRNGQRGWFARERGVPTPLALPPDAAPKWSPSGSHVAFSRAGAPDSVFVGPPGNPRGYHMPGAVTDFAWLPNESSLAVMTLGMQGISSISLLELERGASRVIAGDLDAPTLFASRLAVAPNGNRAYVALASPTGHKPHERHRPFAQRRLGIYEVDLKTGARRPVVPGDSSGDAFAPAVASGFLYWTYTAADVSIVTLPSTGGTARLVIAGAQIPSWHPNGRQIGYVYGDWRLADWGLNWDGGAIEIDTTGRPIGPPTAVITGYHEDFQPVWSPHGRWIAYHSHRTDTPVTSFLDPAPDDIWLRRLGTPARDTAEIRLTDFGLEANSPDWSPDGTRLLFTSFESGYHGEASVPFLLTIDTVTGKPVRHRRLPIPKEVQTVVWAAWSPAADEVALESDLGGGRHALWVVNTAGTSARRLTDYPMRTYGGVSWAPDGQTLVYAALSEGRMQIFAIPAAGGQPRQLTDDTANLFTPRVSPSGTLIAATRLSHRKEIRRIRLTH
jgi:hypothetical protein